MGRAPGAGGGGGGPGGCRYSRLSARLLLRHRLLPPRRAASVARRGRTPAPLPSEAPRCAPARDVGRGEAPEPRLRAASAPPRLPGRQVRTRPRAGRGRGPGGAAAARSGPRGGRGWGPARGVASPSAREEPGTDLGQGPLGTPAQPRSAGPREV